MVSFFPIVIAHFGYFLLDLHIPKLVGIENLATFDAFYIFRIFGAGDNADFWVFAGDRHSFFAVSFRRPLGQIVPSLEPLSKRDLRKNCGVACQFTKKPHYGCHETPFGILFPTH